MSGYSLGAQPAAGSARLHLNEFRFTHHPDVIDVVKGKTALSINQLLSEYVTEPDPQLRELIAQFVGTPDKHIVLSAGSDEVLRAATLYAAEKDLKTLLMGVPAYTHFELFAKQAKLQVLPVQLGVGATSAVAAELFKLEEEKLAGGSLVYLASPNNPTGGVWDVKDLAPLLEAYPKSLFIVDEAYIEFESIDVYRGCVAAHVDAKAAGPALNAASVAGLTKKYGNLLVTRTFSKAFGLAGLRIGYGIASPALAAQLETYVSPKSVTALAMGCAAACLRNLDHYLETTRAAGESRRAIAKALGAAALSSGGNYVLVHVGDAAAAEAQLRAAGVVVRDRSGLPGLGGCVRITAGTATDTQRALQAIKGLKPAPPALQAWYTPKTSVATLRRMLAAARRVLDASGVAWWATDGTLMGALRHGGLIPWDDDVDLGYVLPPSGAAGGSGAPRPPLDPLATLGGAFAEAGLTLQRNRTNAYWQLGLNAPGKTISAQHIDLFPYFLDGKTYRNADPRFQAADPAGVTCNASYAPAELFPLRAAPFYGGTLPAPANGAAALDRATPGWRTHGAIRGGPAKPFPIGGYAHPA